MEQLVKIKNTGDTDFRQMYGPKDLVEIPAGDEIIVPYSYLVAFMGDPNVRNGDRWREREELYDLFVLMYGGKDTIPKLEAYDLNDNRIITVLDDPAGSNLTPVANDTTDVGLLQRQIDELSARLSTSEQETVSEPDVEVPTDEPTQVPTGRSRKR